MENKKTAVFGIYTDMAAADAATDTFVSSGFSASDISALLPENLGSKEIGTKKATKAPEGAATGAARERFLAVRSGCWLASALLQSRVLVRLSPLGQLSRLSLAWA